MEWAWNLTTSSATASWTPVRWSPWRKAGSPCRRATTARLVPFSRLSECFCNLLSILLGPSTWRQHIVSSSSLKSQGAYKRRVNAYWILLLADDWSIDLGRFDSLLLRVPLRMCVLFYRARGERLALFLPDTRIPG